MKEEDYIFHFVISFFVFLFPNLIEKAGGVGVIAGVSPRQRAAAVAKPTCYMSDREMAGLNEECVIGEWTGARSIVHKHVLIKAFHISHHSSSQMREITASHRPVRGDLWGAMNERA